jgi:hypothetical protein
MKNLILFTSFVAALTLSACWSNETANLSDVKQTEVHQSYWITYDASDKELSASASFRFGGGTGTTLLLDGDAEVAFDGEKMAMENNFIQGTYYSISKQDDFNKSYSFKFTDADKNVFTNKISCNTIAMQAYPNQIDKANSFEVKWDNPITNGERVTLYLEDSKNKSTWVTTDVVGSTALEMNSESMKDLFPGNGQIYLVREVSNALSEASHLGGNITLTYTSPKAAVTLTGPEPVAKN